MTGGNMDRETAHAFACERCLKETTHRHLISVEGVMRSLARRFDEDQDLWGLTGLFHDLDQDHTGDDGDQHALLAAGWLHDAGVDRTDLMGCRPSTFAPASMPFLALPTMSKPNSLRLSRNTRVVRASSSAMSRRIEPLPSQRLSASKTS